MTIVDYYHNHILMVNIGDNDFKFYPFKDDFYIGFDNEQNICIAVLSSSNSDAFVGQKTKMLSVECNVRLNLVINGIHHASIFHVIRCFSKIEKERELFLELVDSMILKASSEEEIMDSFSILYKFFSDKTDLSDGELMGLYTELYTIITFSSSLHLEKYWQTRDKMKFDFSFSDTLKLEVKSSVKSLRQHHFRHEQLLTGLYDIYIISYLLRYDDEGISLLDVISKVKPLLFKYPVLLAKINLVLKNTPENRLKSLKFNNEYTLNKRKIYDAVNIPRFFENTPEGVANAEYDCDLENVDSIPENDFIKNIKEKIK